MISTTSSTQGFIEFLNQVGVLTDNNDCIGVFLGNYADLISILILFLGLLANLYMIIDSSESASRCLRAKKSDEAVSRPLNVIESVALESS